MRTVSVVTRAGLVFFGTAELSDVHADTSSPHSISTGMMTPTRAMRAPSAEAILARR